jgi:pfkB family carbohydrate kinase
MYTELFPESLRDHETPNPIDGNAHTMRLPIAARVSARRRVRLARVRDGGAKVAVVGHVEWVQFARVEHVPAAGEVVHARGPMEEPAGGGAVAAVQLARLAGEATLFTALGDDEYGHRSVARLHELGVEVRASFVKAPTRRAVTLVDDAGERTITTFGPRLDPLGEAGEEQWEGLEDLDAVYFTAGDVSAPGSRGDTRARRQSARATCARPRRSARRARVQSRRRDRGARGKTSVH